MTEFNRAGLIETISAVAQKAKRSREAKIGEQNTKASLVEPVLEALGWDTRDWEEVTREYKSKSRDKPVDYALKIIRKPRLFIEAKGLGENLTDRRWVSQVLSYATVAGVQWCVLTDGNEYHIYNAAAPVDAEEKLFRRVALNETDTAEVAQTLELISRSNLEENLLDVLWAAYFVDRRVKSALQNVIASQDKALVRLLRKVEANLAPREIAESLARLDITIGLPDTRLERLLPVARATNASKPTPSHKKMESERRGRSPKVYGVKLSELIEACLLSPPTPLFRKYKGRTHRVVLREDGNGFEYDGDRYRTLTAVAKKITGSHTNGFRFFRMGTQR
jgi:predicted type IV restriction endonuclease